MRLRNNFIEMLQSGELPPDIQDWLQLEPDDFFYIRYNDMKSEAEFIKAINTLIRVYKVNHKKVSITESKERQELHKQMPFIRYWKMLLDLNQRYRVYSIHRKHFNQMCECLSDYDGDCREGLLSFIHHHEKWGWKTFNS